MNMPKVFTAAKEKRLMKEIVLYVWIATNSPGEKETFKLKQFKP